MEHHEHPEEHEAAQDTSRDTPAHHRRMDHHRGYFRFMLFSLLALIIAGAVAGTGYWAYWNFWARWRPVTIATNQAAIQRLLDEGGWVSPGRSGAPLYLITYRACGTCNAYMAEEFPKFAAANVDTRVLVFARSDREGLSQSTPAERSTVAELWINRDWNLFARWMATPRRDWTAPDIRASDTDYARRAVVTATRSYVNELIPLLKGAGLNDQYPILIWRDRDGYLKACACSDRRSFHFVRADLGAPSKAPAVEPAPVPEFQTPEPAPAPVPAAPPAEALAPLPPAAVPPAEPVAPPTESAPAAEDAPSVERQPAPPAREPAAKAPPARLPAPKKSDDPRSIFY